MSEPFFKSRSTVNLCRGTREEVSATLEQVQALGNHLVDDTLPQTAWLEPILCVPLSTLLSALGDVDSVRAHEIRQEVETNYKIKKSLCVYIILINIYMLYFVFVAIAVCEQEQSIIITYLQSSIESSSVSSVHVVVGVSAVVDTTDTTGATASSVSSTSVAATVPATTVNGPLPPTPNAAFLPPMPTAKNPYAASISTMPPTTESLSSTSEPTLPSTSTLKSTDASSTSTSAFLACMEHVKTNCICNLEEHVDFFHGQTSDLSDQELRTLGEALKWDNIDGRGKLRSNGTGNPQSGTSELKLYFSCTRKDNNRPRSGKRVGKANGRCGCFTTYNLS
jgi:hypothetical protein